MKLRLLFLPVFFLPGSMPFASAQFLSCSPQINVLPFNGNLFIGGDPKDANLKIQYLDTQSPFGGAVTNEDNYVLLAPSTGTTPLTVTLYINMQVLAQRQPGSKDSVNIRFTTIDQTPARIASCRVDLSVPNFLPIPVIGSVVNSASLQPTLSPGALVSILGSDLTGPTISTKYGPTANFPTTLAGTSVMFNATPAPLLSLSPNRIDAIVPFAMAGQTSANVTIKRFTAVSAAIKVPLQTTSPGIFMSSQANSVGILQQGPDGQFTYNSSNNPAAKGAALEIFATGMGVWNPQPWSDVWFFQRAELTYPVSVTIGGQPAKVLYSGLPGIVLASWSILQVNVLVPDGVGAGLQPVVLKIGDNDNSQQKVTIWVQ